MIPVDQDRMSSEWGGGNCLAACLASILELKLSDLPDRRDFVTFSETLEDGSLIVTKTLDWDAYMQGTQKFLGQFNLSLLTIPFATYADHLDIEDYVRRQAMLYVSDIGYYISYGSTARDPSERILHSVVCKGHETLHDPHPTREGLVKIRGLKLLVHRNPQSLVDRPSFII